MQKEDIIINKAMNLFCKNGFHGTSIDNILSECNVSKMTLYKYFKTKNDLIKRTLDHYNSSVVLILINDIDSLDGSAKEKVIRLFDKFIEITGKNKNFRCIFINVFLEFEDSTNEIYRMASEYKLNIQRYIEKILENGEILEFTRKSMLISSLIEGSLVMFYTTGRSDYYSISREYIFSIL